MLDQPAELGLRDGRLSGVELSAALAQGINQAGVDVIDIGCVPTPVTYFAAHELGTPLATIAIVVGCLGIAVAV